MEQQVYKGGDKVKTNCNNETEKNAEDNPKKRTHTLKKKLFGYTCQLLENVKGRFEKVNSQMCLVSCAVALTEEREEEEVWCTEMSVDDCVAGLRKLRASVRVRGWLGAAASTQEL